MAPHVHVNRQGLCLFYTSHFALCSGNCSLLTSHMRFSTSPGLRLDTNWWVEAKNIDLLYKCNNTARIRLALCDMSCIHFKTCHVFQKCNEKILKYTCITLWMSTCVALVLLEIMNVAMKSRTFHPISRFKDCDNVRCRWRFVYFRFHIALCLYMYRYITQRLTLNDSDM